MLDKFLIVFELLHAQGKEDDAVLKTSPACLKLFLFLQHPLYASYLAVLFPA
jgi:hypothetical protein